MIHLHLYCIYLLRFPYLGNRCLHNRFVVACFFFSKFYLKTRFVVSISKCFWNASMQFSIGNQKQEKCSQGLLLLTASAKTKLN